MPNSSQKYKCPCVEYTKMHISSLYVPKTVDIPNIGCYTLPINLRNESIEARFARVWLLHGNGNSGSRKGTPPKFPKIYRIRMLGRRRRSAGLSQILVKCYQWSFGAFCIFPYFHGSLCRRSIFYSHRRGYSSGIKKKRLEL